MKKMNNKGFSLVELIVVIAIMAVLVGVLAPQFIKYVENSRRATDVSTADSIRSSILADIADQQSPFVGVVNTKTPITDSCKPTAISEGPKGKSTDFKDQSFTATWNAKTGTCDVYMGDYLLTDPQGAADYKNQKAAGSYNATTNS